MLSGLFVFLEPLSSHSDYFLPGTGVLRKLKSEFAPCRHFSGEETFSDPESTVVGHGPLTKQSQFRAGQPSVDSKKAKL